MISEIEQKSAIALQTDNLIAPITRNYIDEFSGNASKVLSGFKIKRQNYELEKW